MRTITQVLADISGAVYILQACQAPCTCALSAASWTHRLRRFRCVSDAVLNWYVQRFVWKQLQCERPSTEASARRDRTAGPGKGHAQCAFVSLPGTLDSTLAQASGACPASLRGAGALCLARVLEHDSQSGPESAGCLACGQVMPRFGPTSAAQAVGHLFQDGISCLTCNALIPEVPAAHGCWCKGVRNYAVAGVVLMLKR